MLRIAAKGALARRRRLLTTTVAVVVGVAFVVGSSVLTSTVDRAFEQLFDTAASGIDAAVRAERAVEVQGGEVRQRIPESTADDVAAVEGVRVAAPVVQSGSSLLVGRDGEPLRTSSFSPTFGLSWVDDDDLNPWDLDEGRAPAAPDEVVIDRESADRGGFQVGDEIRIQNPAGTEAFTITGTVTFGGRDGAGGATAALFTHERIQELAGYGDEVDLVVAAAAEGVGDEQLVAAIAEVLPPDLEAVTGAELSQQQQDQLAGITDAVGQFTTTFAYITLFVGAFTIYNTFSILVGQRTGELALLRALGASRRQVTGAVLLEAAAVAAVAVVLGTAAGWWLSIGLARLLEAAGISLPTTTPVLTGGAVAAGAATGVVVTLVSALLPARRAARVPPLAAMRAAAVEAPATAGRRVLVGGALAAAGVVALVAALVVTEDVRVLAAGAVLTFVGITTVSPVLAVPFARVAGGPVRRWRGVRGQLAVENAVRNPRRTANTAAALMVGVALVSLIATFAHSVQRQVADEVAASFAADLAVSSGQLFAGGLPTTVRDEVAALDGVAAVAPLRITVAELVGTVGMDTAGAPPDRPLSAPDEPDPDPAAGLPGEGIFPLASDTAVLFELLRFGEVRGDPADLGADGVAVWADQAQEQGWSVGDEVVFRFAETGGVRATVEVVFESLPDPSFGPFLFDLPFWEANVAEQGDLRLFVRLDEGASAAEARRAIERVVEPYAAAEVQDLAQYEAAITAQLDQVLALVYVLLLFAVVISVLGISNTLQLSVMERVRELGLLRAVGMHRAQVASMVRWESVLVASFGTLLGIALGLGFSWAIITSLEDDGLAGLVVPWGQLALVVGVGGAFGVIAARRPARRAARLDVLRAIGVE